MLSIFPEECSIVTLYKGERNAPRDRANVDVYQDTVYNPQSRADNNLMYMGPGYFRYQRNASKAIGLIYILLTIIHSLKHRPGG